MGITKKSHSLNKQFRDLLQIGNESNCRWLFHNFKSHKAKCCVGNPSKKRRTTTYDQFICESEGEGVEFPVIGGINVFYSVNQYLDYNINALLWQLHANYLDIDIRNKERISQSQSHSILNRILDNFKENKIPRPNAIVSSGSGGWHLYWAYEPVNAYKATINDWKNVTRKIIKSIRPSTEFVVDKAASMDPGRVLRLPGTFHFNAKDHCECIELSEAFQFELLMNELKVEKFKFPEKKLKTPKPKNKKKPNYVDYWGKIYYQLVNHAVSGYVSKKHHNRDEFLFISFTALKQIHSDKKKAFDKALALNERFGLLPEDEVINNLSTARRVDYLFKKETLSNRFDTFFPNLDQSFLESNKKEVLSPIEVKEKQAQSAAATNNKRTSKTQEKLLYALKRLEATGSKQTLKAVSEISGVSYRTVKKYKDFIAIQKGEVRSRSIYPPQGGVF